MGSFGSQGFLFGAVVSFAIGLTVLEFYDISLPRGDSIGVSGALNSAAIILIGPVPSVLAAFVGTLGAFLLRRCADRNAHATAEWVSVAYGFGGGFGAYYMLGWAQPWLPVGPEITAGLVASGYLLAELVAVQVYVSRGSGRPARRLVTANLLRQAPILAAQISACILAVLMFKHTHAWGLALVCVLLLLIRQSYAMFLEIQETYRMTIEVLVEAAEGSHPERAGHADRSAQIAREIGSRCGMHASDIERLSYAALLHEVDAMEADAGASRPSRVLQGVKAFDDVARILQVFEGTQSADGASDTEILSAFIVSLSSEIDALREGLARSHESSPLRTLAPTTPSRMKAQAVSAAIQLGYQTPAI